MTTILGFEIVVCQYMTGAKKAVKQGNTIAVSPAMYDLMKHATQDELEHLIGNLPVIDIGEPFKFDLNTMETRPPSPDDLLAAELDSARPAG